MKGWVEKLLGEMQKQDIATWRANTKAELQDLLKSDKRGLILSMIHKFEGDRQGQQHPRQHLRLHRRGASLGRQGPRHLPDGRRAKCHDHRLHRHADRQDGAGRRHVQDLRQGRRAGLPRQVFDRRVHRGRDDAADQAHHGAERDDRAGRAAGQGVLRACGSRGRHRHRRAQQGTRSRRRPAHLPHCGRSHREGGRLRRRALQGERAAARLQGVSGRREPRGVRKVQERARQAAAAGVDARRSTPRTRRTSSTARWSPSCRSATSARPMSACCSRRRTRTRKF